METPLSEVKLKVLYEISRIISQALDPDQALEKVLQRPIPKFCICQNYINVK